MSTIEKAIIHPLVLLSAVDHYNRVAKDTKKRVIGILLGSFFKGTVDVTNSFAVPFEEDLKNPNIWYIDYNYIYEMATMFRKVNASEKIVGFYSSGLEIKINDLDIEEQMQQFVSKPLYCVIDTKCSSEDLPVKSYIVQQEVNKMEGKIYRTFKNIESSIGAIHVEEVAVSHLLRDVNDPLLSSTSQQIQSRVTSLTIMEDRLKKIFDYLNKVIEGKVNPNNEIIYNVQYMLNLLPNLNIDELRSSVLEKTNDIHIVLFIAYMVRSINTLYDVVVNHLHNQNN